jgi:prevent-host-death family protein
MTRLTASKARDSFSDTVNRVAYRGERIVLLRRGKAVAALVPVADFERLAQLSEEEEDRLDNAVAEKALRETGKNVPWARVKKRAGLK